MTHRVLIVDDEAHVTQVMKTFLVRAGFTVDCATNGIDALERIRHDRPDAVISDYEMPRMNGRELIDAILAEKADNPRLIVLVTSRTDPELREWIAQHDRVGFVEKPASPRRLVRYIEAQLASSEKGVPA